MKTDATPHDVDTMPWKSPHGTPLHLAAALPMYTWTDLLDALMPNGRASDHFNGAPSDGNRKTPVGVEKQSYVAGLFALGTADAQYAKSPPAPGADPTADLNTWFAEVNAGEPYTANPNLPMVISQIAGPLRSPFAMPVPSSDRKPVFVIQGLTDPLFPATQALTMINRLKAADSNYPVWAFLGDIGHSYAQNPLDVWQQAHDEGNAWLTAVLAGDTPTQSAITVDSTRCVTGQTLRTFSGAGLGAISTSHLTFTSSTSQTMTSDSAVTYEGEQSDPIANSGCRSMAASDSDPDQASYTFTPATATTLAGGPVVHVAATVDGSSAELAARLWDVDASGTQTLITRAVYRLEEAGPTTTVSVSFELPANVWQLQQGHAFKLELTQDDAPDWRPDNEPSSITITSLKLVLPVRPGV